MGEPAVGPSARPGPGRPEATAAAREGRMTLLIHSILLLALVFIGCAFVALWRAADDDSWDSY